MEGFSTDDAGAPVVARVSEKVGALERRATYLERQLSEWPEGRRGQDFVRGELAAVRAGIAALRYHRAEVEGLDAPMLALQELVEAAADAGLVAQDGSRWAAAVKRGERLLEEWR